MKMNTFQMEQQEDEFSKNLSYEEWLRDNLQPLTIAELNKMEKQHKAFIIKKPSIFPYPINTYNYQPLQGA
ncbi:MAG: hypothetical protein PHF17_01590 [Arcobacteraceae bacterium]|nr:hypothetical protein [Arcobacteraceae bacterium]